MKRLLLCCVTAVLGCSGDGGGGVYQSDVVATRSARGYLESYIPAGDMTGVEWSGQLGARRGLGFWWGGKTGVYSSEGTRYAGFGPSAWTAERLATVGESGPVVGACYVEIR